MLTMKTSKRRQWRRFGVFIVDFEDISQLPLVFSTVDVEQVNACWGWRVFHFHWNSWRCQDLPKLTLIALLFCWKFSFTSSSTSTSDIEQNHASYFFAIEPPAITKEPFSMTLLTEECLLAEVNYHCKGKQKQVHTFKILSYFCTRPFL